jgi:hypothetical protein
LHSEDVPVLFTLAGEKGPAKRMAMITRDMEAPREALAATVAGVLRQQARHSAHPADLAALRQTAAQIVFALQAEFHVVVRHPPVAEVTHGSQISEHAHE